MLNRKFLILFVLIAFICSVGGVFAEDTNTTNTTLDSVDSVPDETLLTDTSYVNNSDDTILSSDDLVANFTADTTEGINSLTVNFTDTSMGNPTGWLWDFGDGYNSTLQNPTHTYNSIGYFNVSLKILNNDSSSVIVKDDFVHIVYDRVIFVNPDFEDGTRLVGWDYSASSVYSSQKNAKTGKRFAQIQDGGFISQLVHLDTVDYIGFWYMSTTKDSSIDVLLDDKSILKYIIHDPGMGKWEFVLLNTSDITGFHTLKFLQNNGLGYIDSIDLTRNRDICVNFTLTSFSLVGDNLTLSFNDYSYGFIDGWLWDFGDGTTSKLQNATHSFKTGHYTITLTLYNDDTTRSLCYTVPISFPANERTGMEYVSVQDAVDNAVAGDVINIPDNIFYNTFSENIVIGKDLTLNFFNCTLVGDGFNPSIIVIDGADVVVNNISAFNVFFKTDGSSKLTLNQLNSGNVTLINGNFEFKNSTFLNSNILNLNANCIISNCNFTNGSVVVTGGKSKIVNSTFNNCDVAVTQTAGELELTSNIISNNNIGVNVTGGVTDLAFNILYGNNVSLVFNSSGIVYDDNWWGSNQPVYNYSSVMVDCDILQLEGIESLMNSWIVLNITQSNHLDYEYYIAGITYYNLTVDFTHNNLGRTVNGYLKDFNLTLTSVENHIYYEGHSYYGTLEKIVSFENSMDCAVINGLGECIVSLGYLTSDLKSLNVTIFDNNYTVLLSSNVVQPNITYVTPCTIFDDNLTVEICCDGLDAVIFYTLDGSNPAYSPTRLVYHEPFMVNESTTLHYTVIDCWGNFQKTLIDTIRHVYISFIKQDVFVELYPLSKNIYYSLDGSKFGNKDIISNVDDYNYYYHPFVVFKPTEIFTFAVTGYNDYGQYYPTLEEVYLSFYSLDFSCNYIKNSSFNKSDAIWSQYQGDVNNTGVTNYTGPLSNQSSWANENVFSSGSAVVDSKGRIVVGGSDGYLYYLNKLGQVIWRFGTASRIICTPTIGADGNFYFSNWMNSSVYCISPEGELIWKYNLGDYNTGTSPVFGLDNRLYIITSNNLYSNMYVFKDGVLLSNHTIPFISGSTPVVSSDGLLYLVSANHELVILNYDGSLMQAKFIDSGAMVLSDNQDTQISISMGDDGTIYVLNYYRSSNFESYSSGLHDEDYDSYYFYYYVVNAFDLNGVRKWVTYDHYNAIYGYLTPLFREYVSGTPTYYNGVIYIAGNDNLIAINASNGFLLWKTSITSSGSTASSPLVRGDGVLYVTSGDMVYAFSLDGDLIWQYQLPGNKYGSPISFSSPTLTADGTLIVTTNQGIYAFKDIAADFRYEHVNGTETTIQFTDLSTKGNNRYYWMFGDGNISREQNPIHEYSYPGTYRVVLLVEHNGTIDLMRNKTITVELYDITPPSNVTAYINNNITSGGVFNQTQIISLNATDKYSGVVIYYTVDGSNPMNSSTRRVYNGPFEVEVDTTLSMVACDGAGNWGNITSIDFRITDVTRINSTLIDEIQSMLDNAEAYSKILFDFDTILGANFTVNKPLNIISNNNTRLVGVNGQPSITFAKGSEGSILNGFEIVNDGGDGVLIEADDILIRNCLVNVTNATGINVYRSNGTIIVDTGVCNADEGIVVNQSTNTLIDGVSVRDCYSDGIWVYQSQHTIIVNSLIEDNGKDPYKLLYGGNDFVPSGFKVNIPASESRANNILIDDSINNYIYNNTINHGYFGIHLYHFTENTVIDNNIIYETVGDAILLSNDYFNVNIVHNLIEGCYNGIDFMGYSENVTIKQNTIKLLHSHEGDLYSFDGGFFTEQLAGYVYETYFPSDQFFNHRNNGIQVSYPASNFDEGNTVIIDNVVIRLGHRSWEARKYCGYIDAGCDSYGYNLMDGSSSYNLTDFGGATSYREGKVDLVIDRIGDATFRLRLINRLDNHYLSEIPEFDVIFTTGGFSQTVKFINDSAIAEFDVSMAVSDIEAIISGEIRKSAHFDIPITEGYTSSNRAFDPGFEKGEAYNNPDPVIPKIPPEEDDYKPTDPIVNPPIIEPVEPVEPETGYGNGTGDGQGTGNGTGTGDGDGNGSSGSFGTGKNNIFGELNKLSGQVADFTGIGEVSSSEDVSDDSTDGMDRSSEGGSDAGSGETVHAYEVSKVINVDESNWKFVVAVVLFSCIVLCGYAYRKRRGDGDEI